jgi:hypothetical protein
MAKLMWGKPTIEIAPIADDGTVGSYTAIDTPQQNSTQLNTDEGEEAIAREEGGAIVDSKRDASSYSLVFALFNKKGSTKPIADVDGVVIQNYAVRWWGEDPAVGGYQMLMCSVSCAESYTTADGALWTYTFRGLKPSAGAILQKYTVPSV